MFLKDIDIIHQVSVRDKDVLVSIVIIIKKFDTPSQITVCYLCYACSNRIVGKEGAIVIAINGIGFCLVIADGEVEFPVVVIVTEIRPHPSFFFPHIIIANA